MVLPGATEAIIAALRQLLVYSSIAPLKVSFVENLLLPEETVHMQDRIEIDPRVCGGKPVIRGTRVPVSVILDQLSEDESWESLLEGYPELTRDDIRAALVYAKTSIEHTDIMAAVTA